MKIASTVKHNTGVQVEAEESRKSARDRQSRQATRYAALLLMFAVCMALPGRAEDESRSRMVERLEKQIRHELIMLPQYNVFDHLTFRVNDEGIVVLNGSVVRPTLKSAAEKVVGGIEGVTQVDNRIEVLPLSRNDDVIRRDVFRAIYSRPGLDRYGFQAIPSIHIIVNNGHVALEGVVANAADRNLAGMQANGVSGVFSVKNNLRVENQD